LPDGLFAYQKFQFGNILEGLGVENKGIFGVFMAIRNILGPFGKCIF
jgi:hypothetical protein